MQSGIKNTYTENFRKLLGNGSSYYIPKYQRDYSWDDEQWSDLYYDIVQMRENNDSHYMGYLVLQTNDEKNYQITDGQQRITSISLLILAAIKCLKGLEKTDEEKEINRKRAEHFHSTYIGNIDVVTLTSQNKLKLNKNNDAFYKNYLSCFVPSPQRGLKASEKLMKRAFEYFEKQLKPITTAEEIISFIEDVVESLYFTIITVSDDLNAYKVFETLNARGVQLSSSDLLKNYIFSIADSTDELRMNELEDKWFSINDRLKDKQISEYLRVYYNSTHKLIRKNQVYKEIRNNIKNIEDVFNLVNSLSRNVDTFIALQNPEDEMWRDKAEVKDNLSLLKIFNIEQPLSLLLIAYDKLSEEEFVKLLKRIVVISFRYNIICSRNPNDQGPIYNKCALEINSKGSYKKDELYELYIQDVEFESSFKYKEFNNSTRNKKIVKYILSKIEKQKSSLSLDDGDYTIEHILPENSSEDMYPLWDSAKADQYKYRLGNLTLLQPVLNRDLGALPFSDKKLVYSESNIAITKEISDVEEWTEAAINKRQTAMAKIAKTIWSLN